MQKRKTYHHVRCASLLQGVDNERVLRACGAVELSDGNPESTEYFERGLQSSPDEYNLWAALEWQKKW